VHNVAAGYWSIATGAMTTSSVLSAFDASFGAGLLEALSQVVVDNTRTVLLACDTAYPEPLYSARPIPDAFGIALVLAPQRSAQALVQITVGLTGAGADRLDDATRGIALRQDQHVVLDYLDRTRLAVAIALC
jgi:hypothetical protein